MYGPADQKAVEGSLSPTASLWLGTGCWLFLWSRLNIAWPQADEGARHLGRSQQWQAHTVPMLDCSNAGQTNAALHIS